MIFGEYCKDSIWKSCINNNYKFELDKLLMSHQCYGYTRNYDILLSFKYLLFVFYFKFIMVSIWRYLNIGFNE